MLDTVSDYVNAHRKLILAFLTAVLPQIVDGQVADDLIIIVGLLLTGGVPNDPAAVKRVYRRGNR